MKSSSEWREWLLEHHAAEKEIWLIYPKKHSKRPRIPYADAVEEALCFGWIDSIVKGIDEECYAQRFSPRKKNSPWSQPNIERMRRLIAEGRMTPAGLAALKNPETLMEKQELEIAPDVLEALKKDKSVWKNFQAFADNYKRVRIAYIEAGRKHGPEQFQKRLDNFINKTRKNQQFAFGGVQKEK